MIIFYWVGFSYYILFKHIQLSVISSNIQTSQLENHIKQFRWLREHGQLEIMLYGYEYNVDSFFHPLLIFNLKLRHTDIWRRWHASCLDSQCLDNVPAWVASEYKIWNFDGTAISSHASLHDCKTLSNLVSQKENFQCAGPQWQFYSTLLQCRFVWDD